MARVPVFKNGPHFFCSDEINKIEQKIVEKSGSKKRRFLRRLKKTYGVLFQIAV
jgi:hypothetical protein